MGTRTKMLIVLGFGLVASIPTFALVSDSGARYGVLVTIFLGMAALIPWAVPDRPPEPSLDVVYRNPDRGGRAVVDSRDSNLQVVVINNGRGPAEAVEIRFGAQGAQVWNESGNSPDPDTLSVSVHPPRFLGRDRVLSPGDEWPIALLSWYHDARPPKVYEWEARARGMQRGCPARRGT